MPRSIALLLLVLVACKRPREVSVRISIPGLDSAETPASGITVLALPYDRDSVLAGVIARARSPRPNTAPLDSAFAEFRGPFVAFSAAAYRVRRLRDSVAALAARLDSAPAGSAEQAAVRGAWRAASDSLAAVEGRQAQAQVALDSARDRLRQRGDSLRAAVQRWEDSTYEGWDSIVHHLAFVRAQEPRADTTDATGWARFTLPQGGWWIFARAWDVGDPNAEWYWNIRVTSDTVVLSSETAQHRPRY